MLLEDLLSEVILNHLWQSHCGDSKIIKIIYELFIIQFYY